MKTLKSEIQGWWRTQFWTPVPRIILERADLQCWLSSLPSLSPELLESISTISFQADLEHGTASWLQSLILTTLIIPAWIWEPSAAFTVWNQRGALPQPLRPLCPSVLPSSEQVSPQVSSTTLSPALEPPHGAQNIRLSAGTWTTLLLCL